MDANTLRSKLEESGELMVRVAEFDQPLELHLHDTEFDEETVRLQLSDGDLEFMTEDVTGAWNHLHSLAEYGL